MSEHVLTRSLAWSSGLTSRKLQVDRGALLLYAPMLSGISSCLPKYGLPPKWRSSNSSVRDGIWRPTRLSPSRFWPHGWVEKGETAQRMEFQ